MTKNSTGAASRPDPNNPANQSFILDIEDSVRRDEMTRLWKEYGPYLIAGIVLAVIFTAVLSAYRSWDGRVNAEQTTALLAALESPDMNRALDGLGDLRPGHRTVARLTEAAAAVQDKREADAAALFEEIAADGSAPDLYRNLALLESVRLRTGASDVDAKALLERLQPLLKDEKSPWHAQARVQAAILAAHGGQGGGQAGAPDYAQARAHLAAVLQSDATPAALAEKARALDHVYELRAAQAVPADQAGKTDQADKQAAKDDAKE